jgi:hypothetical protein
MNLFLESAFFGWRVPLRWRLVYLGIHIGKLNLEVDQGIRHADQDRVLGTHHPPAHSICVIAGDQRGQVNWRMGYGPAGERPESDAKVYLRSCARRDSVGTKPVVESPVD